MSTQPKPTKRERRDALRAEREAEQHAAALAAVRRRRVQGTAGIIVATVFVVIAVAFLSATKGSSGPKRQPGELVAGQTLSEQLLDGVPQSGTTLGNPKAPVTIAEFADLQCPICKEFSQQELPLVVQDDIRTGKAKLQLHLVNILDRGGVTDSARMAGVAYGAAQQNRLFNFADLVYFNQKEEETGYATDAFLRQIASAVRGLNVDAALAARTTPQAESTLTANMNAFNAAGATGTPTILVGPSGGTLKRLDTFDASDITKAVNAVG